MRATIQLKNETFVFDLKQEIDISIPVRFDNAQMKVFGADPATATSAISIADGAGCNVPIFNFSAHTHGTHTECVGHISKQNHIVQDVVGHPAPMPALVISLTPALAQSSGESYDPPFAKTDMVLTRAALEAALKTYDPNAFTALIIRTLPNDEGKKTRDYDTSHPPFFTHEAMEFITACGFTHLLLDMPSVDRLEDEGKLSNHRIFWGVAQGSHDVPAPSPKTITEFIFVPSGVKDGAYMLALNIGNIRSDAAPSRPVLYEMTQA
ncbi:MAG TPA: cyclase family protein [Alphaproteobacteria bacterium]|nr:cyclase family protein [Alphaproteobacteria bacterium]